MEILEVIDKYGLVVVIIGLLSSAVCGAIKVPVAKKIRSKALSERAASDRIRAVCTLIVAVSSVIGVVLFRCVTVRSFSPFKTKQLYLEILNAIVFSKIAYMLYEGKGSVSLKKWVHSLWQKIFTKTTSTEPDGGNGEFDLISVIQSALTDAVHLPLTDSQKNTLAEYLKPLLTDAAQAFGQATVTDNTNNN